jgi:hypothetical protein
MNFLDPNQLHELKGVAREGGSAPAIIFRTNFFNYFKTEEKLGGGQQPLNIFFYDIKYTKSVTFRLS